MARYRVEMTRFKCRDETGLDFLGSDEVVFSATSFKNKKKRHTDVTKEFGNIDTGDTRGMGAPVGRCDPNDRDPHCLRIPIVNEGLLVKYPEATPARGLKAPFSVLVTGHEIDRGNRKRVKQDVADIADIVEAASEVAGRPIEIPSRVKSRISRILGNDGLGVKWVNFGRDELERSLDAVGDFFTVDARLTGRKDDGDIPLTGGGDYEVRLLVTKVS